MILIEIYDYETKIGDFQILKNESYSFAYSKSWLDNQNNFQIDPLLPLDNIVKYNKKLWGCFEDISPDRWGQIIQNRQANRKLTPSEYMMGVSDYFRIGSLRLKINGQFIAEHKEIPRLININALANSTLKVENDDYTKQHIEMLLSPSGSIGGARPKASVMNNNELYIAKFSSKNDDNSIILWESIMLKMSKISNINTSDYKIIKADKRDVLLIKRFDRNKNERIPFMSAMTLLGINERDEINDKSYVDIANKLNTKNKHELFKRMIFNTLYGNTDDHLRNHGLLYDRINRQWNLSPNYDLNPTPYDYSKQYHALSFENGITLPSIELCQNLADKFEVSNQQFLEYLNPIIESSKNYKDFAHNIGIKSNEIKRYEINFNHKDMQLAKNLINKKQISLQDIEKPKSQTQQKLSKPTINKKSKDITRGGR